ncbi:cold-shock protein [Thiomicrorhabdus lithotrophica]|uniref:Cold shock domain-containing protein n=1 Tax=Thiomicrorhabdus lithotrophica TaxID=2949997 RepID=A0ABY8CCD5_9GAMM|nr:cold shock domain-containing protein [Thiomicrorhabdus lithotrophica]WEJ63656.1 cold shock domain-containing protein [Thiomicrorhabdus lithotrophica]
MAKGIIKRFDFRKGFGFIVDDKTGEDLFFHKTAWQGDGPIRQGLAVKFVNKDSEKGPQADSVIPLDGGKTRKKKPAAKPASLEERVASLESSVVTWKTLTLLSLVGVITLAVLTVF